MVSAPSLIEVELVEGFLIEGREGIMNIYCTLQEY